MHRFQQNFLNAFRAWDGFGMGAALIQIATLLIRRECSQTTQEHLVWSCRELLESMEGHPRLGVSIEVPEGPLMLIVNTEVDWAKSPKERSHTSVFIEMRPGHDTWHRHQYQLEISPDHYHKADVSGGAPYQITLPNACADTLLENESHQITFFGYLRLSFGAGGFPGAVGSSVSARWTEKPIDLLPI